MVAHAGEAPGANAGPFVEAVVGPRAGLEDDGALFGAPLADGGFHPLHIELEHGLQEVVFGIGLVHQPVDGARDEVALLLGLLAEHGGIFAQHIVVDTGEDLTGAVAALDGPLVDVLVEGVVGTAEQAAVDDVHIGIVAGIGEGVATVFGSEVVGQTVERVEVGKGASVGFGHGGQLFVEEEEGERFAILADEHVGPLHQFGPGDGLQVAGAGEGFLGQLLVLGRGLLEVVIGLLDAFLLHILELERTEQLLDDGAGEGLAGAGLAQHQQLDEEGVRLEVVYILGTDAGA